MSDKPLMTTSVNVDANNTIPLRSRLIAGPTAVTVDATAGGQTLATLLGAALEADCRGVTLQIASGTIYVGRTTASAASAPFSGPVLVEIPGEKTDLDALALYAAADTTVHVWQLG